MAWISSGSSSSELVMNMMRNGLIKSDRVASAMQKVDRAHYVLRREDAYDDCPQPIGHSATISAPHMHAHAMENLLPFLNPGARVLDVGSGSGYLCAVLHHLVGPTGKVVGIDHISELVDWSVRNLTKDGLGEALKDGSIEVVTGDGRRGYPPAAPYDAIHVGAASPHLPQTLIDQLASPGRMFVPVGEFYQAILQIDKDANGHITKKELFDVRYVPLTDESKQRMGIF
ncbi:protein-L-isoaspartate O-methyltransferase [Abortiporus biennis]|nr:protein-L-isoaspartate O-methyltransferase [Abortiporus biennis]